VGQWRRGAGVRQPACGRRASPPGARPPLTQARRCARRPPLRLRLPQRTRPCRCRHPACAAAPTATLQRPAPPVPRGRRRRRPRGAQVAIIFASGALASFDQLAEASARLRTRYPSLLAVVGGAVRPPARSPAGPRAVHAQPAVEFSWRGLAKFDVCGAQTAWRPQ